MTAKREPILLILGITISLIRLIGGYWLSSHALMGWGLWSLCELWLRPGINRTPWGLGLLFIITAAAFGFGGGALKEVFKLIVGFPSISSNSIFIPILIFTTLLLWEGGVRRYFKFYRGEKLTNWGETIVLLGGLASFFLIIAGIFFQGHWLKGDAVVGILICIIMLIRLIPSLMEWTMEILSVNSDPQSE